jgi:hypothetical protein
MTTTKIVMQSLQDRLDDMEWNAIWKKQGAGELAKKLADEAREDETEEGGFDGL